MVRHLQNSFWGINNERNLLWDYRLILTMFFSMYSMPLYGRGFTLNNPSDNGFYAPANQPLIAGPYTREAGIWGYNEVID